MAAAACPLAGVFALHDDTLHACDALARLVLQLGQCAPDVHSHRRSGQLLDHFDRLTVRQQPGEEQLLYPALIESVPGSDAVCLRELTLQLAREHHDIQVLWSRLRREVAAVARGGCPPLVVTDTDAFVRLVRGHTERECTELLPLLLRLAPPEVLARVAAGMAPTPDAAEQEPVEEDELALQ